MLINEHKTVQPFYITFNLDNSCKGTECRNKLWLRRNKIQEINAMEKVRKKLAEKFPHTLDMLLVSENILKEQQKRYSPY